MGGMFGGGKQPQAQKQAPAGALNIQTSVYGSVYPLVYGKNRVPINLIHYYNFKAIAHTTKQKTGGKGGGKPQSNTTYTYTTGFAAGFSVGGVAGIGIAWKNKEKHTLASLGLTLFNGAAGQVAWTSLPADQQRPYANLAFVGAPAFNLGDSPSLPNINLEVKGLVPYAAGTIDDALLSDIVSDYLTHPRHGAGFGAYLADLDTGTASFRKYCLARGLFISPIENNQRQAGAFIKEMADIANTAVVWREGKMHFIPYGDQTITGNGATYTPNMTPLYALTVDDFLYERGQPPVQHKEKPAEQAFNHHRIEYAARSNDYNPLVVEKKDQADIDDNGLRPKAVTQYKAITLDSVARDVLEHQQQRDLHVTNTYAFRLGVRHSLLEPMDLVTITEPGLGLVNQLVRIIDINEQDDSQDYVAEEVNIGVANAPLYSTGSVFGYNQDFNVSPGNVTDPLIINAPGMLTATGYEQWIAVTSANVNWGGCVVWVSDDAGLDYRRIGEIMGGARYGSIATSAMPIGTADYDITSVLRTQLYAGQVLGGTQLDCDEFRTLLYVGGEWMSYRDAVLVSGTTYDFDTFRRAAYGSARTAHAVGQGVAVIDEAIFRMPYDKGNVGKNVKFKFQSFNIFGGGFQDLSACVAYNHVLGASELTAPMEYIEIAGSGLNLLPDEYSTLESATLPTLVAAGVTVARNTANAHVKGAYALTATTADGYVYLGAGYNIQLTPGKRYIVQGMVKASPSHSFQFYLQDNLGTHYVGGFITTLDNVYAKFSFLTPEMPAGVTSGRVRLDNDAGVGALIYYDAIMVEQQIGTLTTPSAYTRGDTAESSVRALLQLADISSDNVLTPGEKPILILQRNRITDEQTTIDTQAAAYTITTERTNYNNAISALNTHLATLTTPVAWDNLTGNTNIDGVVFRQKFRDVYSTRQSLLKKIADTVTSANVVLKVINPGFEQGLTGWVDGIATGDLAYFHTEAGGYASPNRLVRSFTSVSNGTSRADAGIVNTGGMVVAVDKRVRTSIAVGRATAAADGILGFGVAFYNATGGYVGGDFNAAYAAASIPVGSFILLSRVATVPATAVVAKAIVRIASMTAGAWWIDTMDLAEEVSNLDEVVDGQLYRRPHVDYVDPSGRLVGMFDDEGGGRRTGGYLGGGAFRARSGLISDGRLLSGYNDVDRVADGTVYGRSRRASLHGGVPKGDTYGPNLIPNPDFSKNVAEWPVQAVGVNAGIVDNWQATANSSYFSAFRETQSSGASNLLLRINSGVSLPASSGFISADASCVARIDVIAGRVYNYKAKGELARATAPPAGVTILYRTNVYWYRADGVFLSETPMDIFNPAGGAINQEAALTAPTLASYALINFSIFFNNTNTVAVTTGSLIADARWFHLSLAQRNNMDTEVEDGTVHGRYGVEDGFVVSGVRRVGTSVKGSRKTLGGARNIRASQVAGFSAVRSTSALVADSAGNITVNAHNVEVNGEAVPYAGVTNAVTGIAVGAQVAVYTFDPLLDGGTRAYYSASTVLAAQQAGEGVVYMGSVTIPSAGTAPGGGGGGTPTDCVDSEAILDCGRIARDIKAGDLIKCWDNNTDNPGTVWLEVQSNDIVDNVPSTRIMTDGGAEVWASDTTPMPVPHSEETLLIPNMLGLPALARYSRGKPRWEEVIVCESVGLRSVCFIRVKDQCYFAGMVQGASVATHNATVKP